MNNFDLYKLLNFIVNKDMYSQAMNAGDFSLELKAKNIRHLRKRLGLPENYTPGVVGTGVNRMTETDLAPFFVEGVYPVNATTGEVTLPNWYYVEDYFTATSRTSDLISKQEASSRLRNALTKPTAKDLAAYIIKKGMKVFPFGVGGVTAVTVLFYRKPVEPSFMLTTNPVTLEYEYSPLSVELEWEDGGKLDILHMILAELGFNIERQEVSQYAMKLVETGK